MNTDLKKALETLKSGGIILYPTDTVWGLGCDATNPEAVRKLFEIKQRRENHSMLLLVDIPQRIIQYVRNVPEIAWDLIEVSDRPLTIIFQGAKNLADNLLHKDGSIGIRVTSDEFCKELISAFRKPVVSTSANITGKPYPACFKDIDPAIINSVDYVVKWRQDDVAPSQPSSILRLGERGEIEIIR
jgi:L-threonylcarbamoyladenylate synthase